MNNIEILKDTLIIRNLEKPKKSSLDEELFAEVKLTFNWGVIVGVGNEVKNPKLQVGAEIYFKDSSKIMMENKEVLVVKEDDVIGIVTNETAKDE